MYEYTNDGKNDCKWQIKYGTKIQEEHINIFEEIHSREKEPTILKKIMRRQNSL